MNIPQNTDASPIRVLFIVDSLYWVIGNFAHQIAKTTSGLETVTCSQFAIRKTINRFGPFPPCFDVVHFLRSKTIQGFWGRFPIVTTFHHLDPATHLPSFQQSDAVMTVSTQWQQHLTHLGIPETQQALVPFGVDTQTFLSPTDETQLTIRKALNINKQAVVLGFSSRRSSNTADRKGVRCFLQALKKLHQHEPNLAALIIGPGWQALAKEIRQSGIPCIQAPYEIIHERIAKYFQAMNLFWVTSRVEGGPVPLLEAMASGLPCISTPVGAALDLINDRENGFIVPFDEPEQFVTRSLQLIQDQTFREGMGQKARKTIVEKRQWNQAGEKLHDLYALAINNFHTRSHQRLPQHDKNNTMNHPNQQAFPQKTMTTDFFYSHKVQSWLQACEQVNGLRMMVEMKAWKAARQFAVRAIRAAPFEPSLWKIIFAVLRKARTSSPH